MNVGLPGTGIGGMFYLLSAVCMPLVEAAHGIRRGTANRWRLVGRELALAAGIVAGIWGTGWLLAVVVAWSPAIMAALQGIGLNGRVTPNILRTATLVVSLSTLGLVIMSVWIASLLVHGRARVLKVSAGARKRARRPFWVRRRAHAA
jgi:hypothetical protein